MPYARRYTRRRYTPRRRGNHSRTSHAAVGRIRYLGTLLPQRCLVKFVASQYFYFLTTSTESYYLFRSNSLWDPQYATGGGTFPGMLFFSAFYNYYRVHFSKMNVKVATGTSATTLPTQTIDLLIHGLAVGAGAQTVPASFEDAIIAPFARYVRGRNITNGIAELTNAAAIYQLDGQSKELINTNSAYAASFTTNPSATPYWAVWVRGDGLVANCYMSIQFEYYAEVFGRKYSTIDSGLASPQFYSQGPPKVGVPMEPEVDPDTVDFPPPMLAPPKSGQPPVTATEAFAEQCSRRLTAKSCAWGKKLARSTNFNIAAETRRTLDVESVDTTTEREIESLDLSDIDD